MSCPRRPVAAAIAFAAAATALAGCSPPNEWAVTRLDGRVALENCGTWISEVEFRDADTGRLVWMARAEDSDTVRPSVGQVVVGELPNEAWVEVGPYSPDPPPDNWLIIHDGSTRVVVADSEVVADRLVHDGRSVTAKQFQNDICNRNGPPIVEFASYFFWAALVVASVLLVGGSTLTALRQRRRSL